MIFPYQIKHIKVLGVQVKLEGFNFQPSPYNIEEQKFVVKPFMDKSIRNSQFCYVSMSSLSNISKPIIKEYIGQLKKLSSEYTKINDQWRLTRYLQNGHFVQHTDRQKLMEYHKHFGTEIFIPPLSTLDFEGGQLRITYNGEIIQIKPDKQFWTYVILPLGIEHQVNKVTKGTRISYVKQIWLKQIQSPIETDQDKLRKQSTRRLHRRNNGLVD